MLEGALIWEAEFSGPGSPGSSKWYIGETVDEVFGRMHPRLSEHQRPDFNSATDAIFARRSGNIVIEYEIDGRFYSTRLLPMTEKHCPGDGCGDSEIEGAIGVIMDMTELKAKEAVLQAQAREKQQLLAREAAAKEASRLKSQFLANVSQGLMFMFPPVSRILTRLRCPTRFVRLSPESSAWPSCSWMSISALNNETTPRTFSGRAMLS
jgi:hypothetical protein